ncbi:MAG TPA: 30S ribosomal protein S18 [Dehalococcoidia bacterium]|nr:30S ribosomal protein S18 [Dehalococcoidia bacterium]
MTERDDNFENGDDAPEPVAGPRTHGGGEGRGPAAGGDDRKPRRFGRRRRVCIMCADHIKVVDYKNVGFLRRFVSDRGRIETRRKSSACAKHQRAVARAIKRARHLALLPYTAEHIRSSGMGHR